MMIEKRGDNLGDQGGQPDIVSVDRKQLEAMAESAKEVDRLSRELAVESTAEVLGSAGSEKKPMEDTLGAKLEEWQTIMEIKRVGGELPESLLEKQKELYGEMKKEYKKETGRDLPEDTKKRTIDGLKQQRKVAIKLEKYSKIALIKEQKNIEEEDFSKAKKVFFGDLSDTEKANFNSIYGTNENTAFQRYVEEKRMSFGEDIKISDAGFIRAINKGVRIDKCEWGSEKGLWWNLKNFGVTAKIPKQGGGFIVLKKSILETFEIKSGSKSVDDFVDWLSIQEREPENEARSRVGATIKDGKFTNKEEEDIKKEVENEYAKAEDVYLEGFFGKGTEEIAEREKEKLEKIKDEVEKRVKFNGKIKEGIEKFNQVKNNSAKSLIKEVIEEKSAKGQEEAAVSNFKKRKIEQIENAKGLKELYGVLGENYLAKEKINEARIIIKKLFIEEQDAKKLKEKLEKVLGAKAKNPDQEYNPLYDIKDVVLRNKIRKLLSKEVRNKLEDRVDKNKKDKKKENESIELNPTNILHILSLENKKNLSWQDIDRALRARNELSKTDQKIIDRFEASLSELPLVGNPEKGLKEFIEKFFNIKKEGVEKKYSKKINK